MNGRHSTRRPPRLVEWWLGHVLPAEEREPFLGDLCEGYEQRLEREGRWRARVWCWRQAVTAPFGSSEHTATLQQPQLKGDRLFGYLLTDLRISCRALAKRPGYSVTAVLTLALGIGVTTSVFSVVHGVLIRPLPFAEPERLVLVYTTFDEGQRGSTTGPDARGWREGARSFADMAAFQPASGVVSDRGEPGVVRAALITTNTLSLLGVRPLRGRPFSDTDPDSQGRPILVSHRFWVNRLGSQPDPAEQRVTIDGKSHSVIGVMPPDFAFPNARVDLWLPLSLADARFEAIGDHSLMVVGRLAPGIEPRVAEQELTTIMTAVGDRLGRTQIRGVAVARLHEELTAGVRGPLRLLMAAVALVLLIAVVNVTHLQLGRTAGRRQEMEVRAALGASRARLLRHVVTESLIVSVAGGLAGITVAAWLVPFLLAQGPGIPRADQVRLDPSVLGFAVGISLLAGAVAALIPAMRMARFAGGVGPTRTAGAGSSRRRVAAGLIVAESALALMLVTGAGLLLHSFVRLSHVDPGLEVDRFVALRVALPESRYADIATQERFARDVLDSLRATAGVEAADLVSHLPFEADFWRYGTIVPERPDHKVPIAFRLVSPGYFETMGIPLQDGRSFTETDRTGSPMVLVLNATAARLMFPGGSAIGGRLDFSFCRAPTCQVVGVVGDVKHLGLDADEEPAMYASVWQKPADWMREMSFLVRAGGEPSGLVDVAKRRIWSVDSALPMLRAETMAQILASTLAPRRFTMTLLAGFALVAALLALVGIQSVVARAVVERRQEIGLRMALGASPGLVVRWMTAEAMTPVLIGLAIGLAGVAGISRILRAELFDLSPYDPATLATACGLMAAAALAASLAPARRAVRIDQVEAMRP